MPNGVVEFPLSEAGLINVVDAAARRGWSVKSVQNWVNAGRLAVANASSGGRTVWLLRIADVDAFTPPPRGRPPAKKPPAAGTKAAQKRRRSP